MHTLIDQAIEEIQQLSPRLLRVLSRTPDDRLNWSPSPTARTPLNIVAHCGFSLEFITEMLKGTPFPTLSTTEADVNFMAMEAEITTREQATELWTRGFEKFVGHLQEIHEDDLAKMIALPFGMGELPLSYMIGVGAMHTREHIGQLEYVQTIYGDRIW